MRQSKAQARYGLPGTQLEDCDYAVSVWFERDRKHIRLETPSGRTVFQLWDDEVDEAIHDGFLDAPRHPRPTDAMWQPCAVGYARAVGLIQ